MVADGESFLVIWSIFYHFFLDDASLGLLLAQCRILVQVSNDVQTWSASKYGGFLRFCTEHSLAEIWRHWVLYLEMETMPAQEKTLLKDNFISGMKAVKSKSYVPIRSAVNAAGPLAAEIFELAPKHFKEFWSTGVTVGISDQSNPCPHLNPTFVYTASGTKFTVHYGTDPLVSFHLAPIFASIKDTHDQPSTIGIKDFVEGARQQFFSLCSSLKSRLSLESSAKLTIRFFVGDALAFCRALHYCGDGNITETGIYTFAWGGSQIDFNVQDYSESDTRRAPLTFNVIDTSNLTDHLGLINILLLTVPLLQQSSASTIYTNSLLKADRSCSGSGLISRTYADIPTLALFLGVAPSPNLSPFTTHSDKHSMLFSATQFPQSISWKFPFSAIPGTTHDMQISNTVVRLVCDTRKLAYFLFSVYRSIFVVENGMELLENTSLIGRPHHYTRNSFVALLGFVKAKAPTDWDQIIGLFTGFIESDPSMLLWLHHHQDLLCQLHLCNLLTVDTLQPTFAERLRSPQDRFHGWKDIPPVVCVVLKVPRRNIKILEDMDPDEISTSGPTSSSRPHFSNSHSSLQFVFGDIERSVSKGESAVKVLEDRKGWEGCSDLIVTFYMPSWILLGHELKSVNIGLHFHVCAAVIPSLSEKIDRNLTIYSTTLMDTEHLQLVRERPGNVGELDRLRTITSVPKSTNKNATEVWTTVGFDESGKNASTLTTRHDITAPNAQRSLSNLASVTTKPVSDSVLEVTFDGYKHLFINPFPVRGSQSKTRIARNHFTLKPDYENFLDLSLNPFPISREGQLFNLLNIHYLNLNRLPALKFPVKHEKLKWVSLHLGLMLSDEEEIAHKNSTVTQHDPGSLVNLKARIAEIFIRWARVEKSSEYHPLALCNDGTVGVYTLIFVNDIRLDLASHTIVADACVIPVSHQNFLKLHPSLESIDCVKIVTPDNETRFWKLLLPALAERCRTWKHLPTCEYLLHGIPAYMEALKFEASPLCSCGKGKDLGTFGTKPEWKELYSEAIRIALSPLFSFSFRTIPSPSKADLENANIGSSSLKSPSEASQSLTQCANCSGPGQPSLLSCSVCKQTTYCSRSCQKSHWKTHKLHCSKASSE